MSVKITDKPKVSTMADTDSVYGNFGGKLGQMSISDFRSRLNDNDNLVLNDLAFYIDVNSASSKGSTRVERNEYTARTTSMERTVETVTSTGVSVAMLTASGKYIQLA